VTDLALAGESFAITIDPYFTKSQVAGLVASYLGETDPKKSPRVSLCTVM